MTGKAALSWLVGRPAFALFGLLAGLFLAAQGVGTFKKPDPPAGVAVRVQPPRYARDWQAVRVECPSDGIVALRPAQRELVSIANKFDLPDLVATKATDLKPSDVHRFGLFGKSEPGQLGERKILNAFAVPRMPWGGEGLATLRPDGVTDVHILANPRPRSEFTRQWGGGAMVGLSDEDAFGQRWRAYLFAEPLRVGSVWLRGEAGLEGRAGTQGYYALLGFEWRRH